MTTKVSIAFYLDCEVDVELLEELDIDYTYEEDYVVLRLDLDETLVDSLQTDELLEFIGIDSEFLVYSEVLN